MCRLRAQGVYKKTLRHRQVLTFASTRSGYGEQGCKAYDENSVLDANCAKKEPSSYCAKKWCCVDTVKFSHPSTQTRRWQIHGEPLERGTIDEPPFISSTRAFALES